MSADVLIVGATPEAGVWAQGLRNLGLTTRIVDPDEGARERLARLDGPGTDLSADVPDRFDGSFVVSTDSNLTAPSHIETWSSQPQPGFQWAVVSRLPGLHALWELPLGSDATALSQALSASGCQPVSYENRPISRVLIEAYIRVSDELLLRHTTPQDLDVAAQQYGATLGPCALQDAIGLGQVPGDATSAGSMRTRVLSEGRLGKVAGVGWHRYPGGGGQVEDPLVEDLLAEEAHFAGITRTPQSAEELVAKIRNELRRASGQVESTPQNLRTVAALALGWENLI